MESIADAALIGALAPMPALIDGIAQMFRTGCIVPQRAIIPVPGGEGRLLVSMPAFEPNGGAVVKLATVFPDNSSFGLPTVQAAIVVFSAHGTPTAILDGTLVTRLRTGAASALASRYLSREDSSHLVIAGTGALAPAMALAHSVVRPIREITVSGRDISRAKATADAIHTLVPNARLAVTDRLDDVIPAADIVTCATSCRSPILTGRLLRPGTFVDLVGSFSPTTREADDDTVARARIFVDTREGALAEAGDLLDPMRRGVIGPDCIQGTLTDLVRGEKKGRRDAQEITLFKSVGSAVEDLAAARIIVANATKVQAST